jgi:tRNA/rRNA methyltransferase
MTDQPAIVLVRPQLGQNIGMAARAMLNCGLSDLRLVAPRDGWPNPDAEAAAAGADRVVRDAKVYATCREALADRVRVWATTARERDQVKRIQTPRAAAADIRQATVNQGPGAILFGPERSGLDNDEIALADTLIRVPLNPGFTSLNLAQAVLLIGYEWWTAADITPPEQLVTGMAWSSRPATQAELEAFYERLEACLEATGYFNIPDKRPAMVRNLRNIFARGHLTKAEVDSLQGVVSALYHAPKMPRRRKGMAQSGEDPDGTSAK